MDADWLGDALGSRGGSPSKRTGHLTAVAYTDGPSQTNGPQWQPNPRYPWSTFRSFAFSTYHQQVRRCAQGAPRYRHQTIVTPTLGAKATIFGSRVSRGSPWTIAVARISPVAGIAVRPGERGCDPGNPRGDRQGGGAAGEGLQPRGRRRGTGCDRAFVQQPGGLGEGDVRNGDRCRSQPGERGAGGRAQPAGLQLRPEEPDELHVTRTRAR